MKQEYTIATGIRKYTGLMFRTRKTNPLIFNFDSPTNKSIHSWFVFFNFKAIWTLEDGTIVQNPPSLIDLFQGNLAIPSNIVQQWGASDDIIFQYVATTLGLTLVPTI
jgi:hypothetical protein